AALPVRRRAAPTRPGQSGGAADTTRRRALPAAGAGAHLAPLERAARHDALAPSLRRPHRRRWRRALRRRLLRPRAGGGVAGGPPAGRAPRQRALDRARLRPRAPATEDAARAPALAGAAGP